MLISANSEVFAKYVQVVHVLDAYTIRLENQHIVRLAGIQPPLRQTPLLRTQAKHTLQELILHRLVTLHYTEVQYDRYGRIVAHVTRDDDLWIQGFLLSQGLVRVYTLPHTRLWARLMLAKEHQARILKKGLWNHPYYLILPHDNAYQVLNQFSLITGVVKNAVRIKSRIYLYFNDDTTTDFTLLIKRKARTLFSQQDVNPLHFTNQSLLVRGWVTWDDGPLIEITHPEQIMLLNTL